MSDHSNHKSSDESSKPIMLLLSGGGFRATLFHLGVIKCLRDRDKLQLVKQIYSVSGGSILAGHLACKWNDYTGKDDQFDRAANELIRFIQSGVRESIIRMRALFWVLCSLLFSVIATSAWLLAGFKASIPLWVWLPAALGTALIGYQIQSFFKPVYQLELAYRRLFGKSRLSHAPDGSPEFFILGTNLTTGNLTAFVKTGVVIDLTLEPASKTPVSVQVPLAAAVAASSAFPPLFSPWIFNPRKYKLDKKTFPVTKYVSDGGVYDNLGIVAAQLLGDKKCDVIVSDAERRFDWETRQSFRFVVPRTSRAFDIAMRRLSSLSFSGNSKFPGNRNPDETPEGSAHGCTSFLRLQDDREYETNENFTDWIQTYTFARQVRTDLDAFSDSEIQCLFFAGYLTAVQCFEGKSRLPEGTKINENGFPVLTDSAKAWLPIKSTSRFESTSAESALSNSHSTHAKFMDWKSPLFWSIVLFGLLSLGINPIGLSLIREWPITVRSMTPDFVPIENADRKTYLAALEPHPSDMETPVEPQKSRHGLLMVSLESVSRWFLNRREFSFSIESKISNSKVNYARAIVYERETGFFRYCLPDDRIDESKVFNCPATSERHILIIYVVLGTDESPHGLSGEDFTIRILSVYDQGGKANE